MNPSTISAKKALKILKKCHAKCGRSTSKCSCKHFKSHVKRPLANGQTPIAAVLSCSDSRVVPEHIFGAPPGALFVVRTAGNVADANAIASLEFAVNDLRVPLVIVLGHQHCGAVKAACTFATQSAPKLTPSLYHLMADLMPAVQGSCSCKDEHLPGLEIKNVLYATERVKAIGVFDHPGLEIVPCYFKFGEASSHEACGELVWL